MIARALEDIFSRIRDSQGEMECDLSISFIEIYNEKVYDLLSPNVNEGVYIKGMYLLFWINFCTLIYM